MSDKERNNTPIRKIKNIFINTVAAFFLGFGMIAGLFFFSNSLPTLLQKDPEIYCTACDTPFQEEDLERTCETCYAKLCYSCGEKASDEYENRLSVEYERGYIDGWDAGSKTEEPYLDIMLKYENEGIEFGYYVGYEDGKNGNAYNCDEYLTSN